MSFNILCNAVSENQKISTKFPLGKGGLFAAHGLSIGYSLFCVFSGIYMRERFLIGLITPIGL